MRTCIISAGRTALLAASAALTLSAHAAPALTAWTGGIEVTSGSDQLYGWSFTVDAPITASALGVYDSGADGLAIAHDVGLYRNSDASLIASATVGAGLAGSFDAGFRYAALGSDVLLAPGQYTIVMTMPELNPDLQIIEASAVTTAPHISYTGSVFGAGSSLAIPDPSGNGSFPLGMFGPNLEIAAAVPEPQSWALALAGLGIVGYTTRRRAARLLGR